MARADAVGLQFVRTTSSYTSWIPAMLGFIRAAGWQHFGIITSSESVYAVAAGQLMSNTRAVNLQSTLLMQFAEESLEFAVNELDNVAAGPIRVVVVMAREKEVLAIAVAAQTRRMLLGFAWLGLDSVPGSLKLKSSEASKAALHGWVYFEPSNVASAAFFDRVRQQTQDRFPEPPDGKPLSNESLSLTPFAANMFDAVLLYAMAASRHLHELSDGAAHGELMVEAMMNVSFDGQTGRVELDANGDMKESIRAINFLLQSDGAMHGKRVGVYNAVGRQYTADPNRTIIWPGGTTSVPVDNLLVAAGAEFNTAWILVGAGSAAVVLVGGLLLFVRKRYRRLQHVLIMLLTEMTQLVWSICIETADLATDGIACFRVLQSDTLGKGYKVAYAVFLCLGILSNVASVAYRLRNALLVRMHVAKLADERDAPVGGSERQRQVQSYQWELKQSHRALVVCGLTLMTVAFQGTSTA
jgi:ABC-type branched-subunit amino acid transport system substrate-binding protein